MAKYVRQQVVTLFAHSVKGLRGVEIGFSPEESMVTGIFGPNGCGKSTILHLLACCYQPSTANGEDHKFSEFFLPTSSHQWSGSAFTLQYAEAEKDHTGEPEVRLLSRRYEKKTDRWTPRYQSRPVRDCIYLGISTCVPRIENETKKTRIKFDDSTPQTESILKHASYVLNREYTSYSHHTAKGNNVYIGVSNSTGSYTELSMGAGEQRVFRILKKVYSAPKHSMILIDEIDLLLHEHAMIRLITHIRDYCKQKSIQLIYTAHRHSILDIPGMNIRHVMQTPERTFCLSRTTPDAVSQLTSAPARPLQIYVEDDLARAVTNKILEECSAHRYATVRQYGSIHNAFTLAGAMVLSYHDTPDRFKDHLYILDGDELRKPDEQGKQMRRAISGDDPKLDMARTKALELVCQFTLPEGVKPEQYIWSELRMESPKGHTGVHREIVEAAQRIAGVEDRHNYVSDIIKFMGHVRLRGLVRVVDTLALTRNWKTYTQAIREWILERAHYYDGVSTDEPMGQSVRPGEDVTIKVLPNGRVSRFRNRETEDTLSVPSFLCGASAEEAIIVFSSRGKAYTFQMIDLPFSHEHETQLSGLLDLRSDETVVGVASTDPRLMAEFRFPKPALSDEYEDPYPHFIALTRQGRATRFTGWPYRSVSSRSGRRFGLLKPSDSYIAVLKTYADDDILCATQNGRILRFISQDISLRLGAGLGSTAIKLAKNDKVVGAWQSTTRVQLVASHGAVAEVDNDRVQRVRSGGVGRAHYNIDMVKSVIRMQTDVPDFDAE